MKKSLILALLIVGIAVSGYAIRVNPGSQASGDSANTAETLVYRDASGNFSAGTVTAATFVATTGVSTPLLVSAPPAAQTIGSGGTIAADACGTLKRITATGNVTTDTSVSIATGTVVPIGCTMDIVNVGGAGVITVDYKLDATILAGAANVVLGSSDSLRVALTATGVWTQIGATGDN